MVLATRISCICARVAGAKFVRYLAIIAHEMSDIDDDLVKNESILIQKSMKTRVAICSGQLNDSVS